MAGQAGADCEEDLADAVASHEEEAGFVRLTALLAAGEFGDPAGAAPPDVVGNHNNEHEDTT